MADTSNSNSQTKSRAPQNLSQSSDLSSLRKSNRPKKPSQLYADGFEDTQKVIGRKGNNAKNNRSTNKISSDNLSTSEKEADSRMEEEPIERGGVFSEKIEYEEDDEYLPYIVQEDSDDDSTRKVAFVTFKLQATEENRSVQRSSTSNEPAGYQIRKSKKKSAYHEDFSYGAETKKSKDKIKTSIQQQPKKGKVVTKPAPPVSATTDFLDFVLSAALNAQASQTQNNENPTGQKSPKNNALQSTNHAGKYSTPKSNMAEEKPPSVIKKQKVSVKKTEPSKPAYQPDEFYQRHLEYKDHYIKEASINGDQVVLKHTKNPQISMKYAKNKFTLRQENLINSNLFEMAMGENAKAAIEEEVAKSEDVEWLTKLRVKEQLLASYFKGVLKDYKPSILV